MVRTKTIRTITFDIKLIEEYEKLCKSIGISVSSRINLLVNRDIKNIKKLIK